MDFSRHFHGMTPERAQNSDHAVRMAMESFIRSLQTEEDEREAIRRGEIPNVPIQTWNISDRH